MKLIIFLLAIALAAQPPDAAQAALKAAIDKEVADGDLKTAIFLYNKVVATYKANKPVAAQALLRLGQCHEKLGQADAAGAYNRLLAQYADQKEAAAARTRLAALARPSAGVPAMSVQLMHSQPEINVSSIRASADGQTVPYVDSVGNIFVRDVRTGNSRQLTTGATAENMEGGRSPISSRDGGRIAYQWTNGKELELRVVPTAGGTARSFGPKFESADFRDVVNLWDWSADGKMIAGTHIDGRTRRNSVFVIDVASGELRTLFSREGISSWDSGSFSADGRLLVAGCFNRPRWGLSVIDVTNSRVTPILDSSANDRYPVWLPTPGKIAFISDRRGKHGLFVTEYRNGAATPPIFVTADVGDSVLLGAGKDGSIYFGRQNTNRDVYLAHLDRSSFRLEGAPVRYVEDHLGHNSAPSWSPSGTSFAYVSVRDSDGGSRVIIRTPGQKDVVTTEPLNQTGDVPKWCGDSKVQVWGTPNGFVRRIFDARTGTLAQPDLKIEGLKAPYQLSYSPDCGTAYVSGFSNQTQRRRFYKVDLATQKETDLYTDDAGWATSPKVSPDGRWLAVVGSVVRDGAVGLLLIPTTGGAPRMVAQKAIGGNPSLVNWSPDSSHVFFFFRKDGIELECFAAPIDGGPIKPTGIRGPGLMGPSLHPDGKRALYSVTNSVGEVWSLRNALLK